MARWQKIILTVAAILIAGVLLIAPVELKLANFYIDRGNENIQKHFYKSALLDFEKASALLPDDEDLKLELGKIYLLKNNLEGAEKEFRNAVKIKNDDPKAYSSLVNTLLLEKKIKEAEQFIAKAPKKVLADLEFQILESRVYADLGETPISLNILSLNESQGAIFYKAVFYIAQKDFTKAQDLLDKIKEEPHDLKNDLSKIKEAFEKTKSSENETFKIVSFAEALNEINEPYLAEPLLKEVLDKNPDYRDALIFLGFTNYLKKDLAKAKDYLNQAVIKDLNYGLSYYFLGKVNLEEKKESEAKDNFEKAVSFGYKTKESFKSLAELEIKSKDFLKAEENFKLALGFDENDKEILEGLTEALVNQKKLDEAESLALKTENNNELLGWIYLEEEDKNKAFDFLKRAEEESPFSAFVSLKLGELSKKQNKISEAKGYFLKTQEYDLVGNWAKIAENEF